jgi:hypothetical protein
MNRAVTNTFLSLCGSCVAAFLSSYALRRERSFNMVDVQVSERGRCVLVIARIHTCNVCDLTLPQR